MMLMTAKFWTRVPGFFSRDARVPTAMATRPRGWWVKALRCLWRAEHQRTTLIVRRECRRIEAGRCVYCGSIRVRSDVSHW